MKPTLLRGLSLVGVVAVFSSIWILGPTPGAHRSSSADAGVGPRFRVAPAPASVRPAYERLVAETEFASHGATPSVHCPSAVELQGGSLYAVWYGGSREGAADVAIWGARYEPASGAWSAERTITTREETGLALGRYVKKLGNVVLARGEGGRLWLFYVSVSVGGWSGSAINLRISDDDGESWGPAHRLVTSPFLNVSTLVKGPAIFYEDGTVGLPVYHELLGKFGELLHLSRDGTVLGKTRLSSGRTSLQPVVVPLTPVDAVAFLRRSGSSPARILTVSTDDGGLSWTALDATPLPNPDSAVFALPVGDRRLLLAYNESENDRSNLKLALSEDGGRSFHVVRDFDPPEPTADASPRFAYPWLVSGSSGDLHLLYTWDRRRIVHVRLHPPGGEVEGPGPSDAAAPAREPAS